MLPKKQHFPIIISSASAAHACAQAINRRIGNIVEFQTRNKLHKAFERIAKCVKRAPAGLRRRLDAATIPLIQEEHADLEVIKTIFDTAVEVFSEYSHHEAAKTAIAVMTYQAPGGERYTIRSRA
jgi:ATP sulfurylase